MLDVLARLFGCQGPETAHDGDALPELYQFGPRQLLSQLRLTRQNDLHQLRAARLKVRQQAHRFENRVLEVLSFVNHQDEPSLGPRFANQNLVQLLVHLDQVEAAGVHSEVRQQVAEEVPV